jgi:hypothetical protein
MEPKMAVPPAIPVLRNERTEDFTNVYANNVALEPSVWDLKLTFGELDQSMGTISQHTAVTVPWTMAKIFSFMLQTQIIAYEMQNRKIRVQTDLLPPKFPVPSDDMKDNPAVQRAYEALVKLREQFIEQAEKD